VAKGVHTKILLSQRKKTVEAKAKTWGGKSLGTKPRKVEVSSDKGKGNQDKPVSVDCPAAKKNASGEEIGFNTVGEALRRSLETHRAFNA